MLSLLLIPVYVVGAMALTRLTIDWVESGLPPKPKRRRRRRPQASGNQRSSFRLSLVGLNAADHGQPEKLQVRLDMRTPQGSWSAVEPCLRPIEARALADWMQGTEDGTAEERIGFASPHLRFESIPTRAGVKLRVYLEAGARPPWAPTGAPATGKFFIDLVMERGDAARAADSLRDQLKRVRIS